MLTSICKNPGRSLAIYSHKNGRINLHLSLMNAPSEDISLTETEKKHLLRFLLVDRENDSEITCEACTRLEDALKYLLDYGAFPPIERDKNWSNRAENAAENLSKHLEICDIYKGENK